MKRTSKRNKALNPAGKVCWRHLGDQVLKAQVKTNNTSSRCALCGKVGAVIAINELAGLLDVIIRRNFRLGSEEKVFDGADDDSGRWEQQGENLETVVGQILDDADSEVVEAVASELSDSDSFVQADGGDPFFESGILYEEAPVNANDNFVRWKNVQADLEHHRRFFSEEAKRLFDWIFAEVENLKNVRTGVDGIRGVVRILGIGHPVFRGRQCDSQVDLAKIVNNPGKALAAPPPEFARSGRMNAEGVPVFYGALDAQTCIAELRPPLAGKVAVGEFLLTRDSRLLDFRALESAYVDSGTLSYFQNNYSEECLRRAFIRMLHRLIGEPVLPGRERQYLITQAMAEYLCHVRQPPFDGLIFESVQRKGGANIVLLRTAADREGNRRGGPIVTMKKESCQLYAVGLISYKTTDLSWVVQRDGTVLAFDPEAEPD